MPTYDHICKKCNKEFAVEMKMSEVGVKKVKCTHCGSAKVERQVTNTSYKGESIDRYKWDK